MRDQRPAERGATSGLPSRQVVLAIVLALSLIYVWALLDRGWVPHDEGALAESALRVLRGQLPHRDFGEIYTGGLTYLNAIAFRIWGERLVSMRYMAFVAFGCWVPVVFYLASRFTRASIAGLITLIAVTWSFPNYTAAMPSWYNLFLATGSIAALFRFVESRRAHWLTAAGALAGLSCLIKVVGLYLVAGSLVFFVLQEQSRVRRFAGEPGFGWYRLFVIAGCTALTGALVALVRARLGWPELVQFVLPGLALAVFVVLRELHLAPGDLRGRLESLLRPVAVYSAGFLLPVVLFVAWYAVHGATADLVAGVLVTPFRRLAFAGKRHPPLETMIPTIAMACFLVAAPGLSRRGARAAAFVSGGVMTAILIAGRQDIGAVGFLSLGEAVPVTVILALVLMDGPRLAGTKAQYLLWILVPVLAISTLIQFPWTDPTYFAYIAPVEILTVAALLSAYPPAGRAIPAILLGFYLAYPVTIMTPRMLADRHSRGPGGEAELATLLPGRADLRVADGRAEYERLVSLIRTHAQGSFIYAAPDCPELYFLSGFRNPTPTLFDFLDEPAGRSPRILAAVDSADVNLVVINTNAYFSGPLPTELQSAFTARFPQDSTVGQFLVRWR